ncbi:MAG TPA: hypothetical protein VIL86_13645 [Tepidisphaeraceae bacterium]|jgi:hypothetical protein
MKTKASPRTTYIGSVRGIDGRFGSPPATPFHSVKLPLQAVTALQALVDKAVDRASRRWVTIAISYDDPNRLRVMHAPPPAYERRAAESYLRGDALRVTGVEGNSVNLDISSRFAVGIFSDLLAAAGTRAQEFVLLRVPNRKHDLIEVVADVDLTPAPMAEQDRLGESGAAAAAAVLAAEDFSDWEGSDA